MGIHTGKGRYLTPENFSNELYLRNLIPVIIRTSTLTPLTPEFNLGPLFCLQDLATKIFEIKKCKFVYKTKTRGQLASYYGKLNNHIKGAAVDTYRKLEVENAHLPISLWKL